MTLADREKYLQALGVPAFLYQQKPTPNTVGKKIKTTCLVVETHNPYSFSEAGKYQDFLFKMLSTIGLKPSDVDCISIQAEDLTSMLQQYQAKAVLLMSKDLSPSSARHFVTHHPSSILADTTLKRDAWEILKSLKQCLT